MKKIILFFTLLFVSCSPSGSNQNELGEIAKKFQKNSNLIIDKAMADSEGYELLGEMLDTFGPRFSGSTNLEKSLEWIIVEMKKDGLDKVHGEKVMVPKWIR